jgi:hypothetical protein
VERQTYIWSSDLLLSKATFGGSSDRFGESEMEFVQVRSGEGLGDMNEVFEMTRREALACRERDRREDRSV